MTDHAARLIERAIVAYDDNGLPGHLILGFKQLRNKLKRARFQVHCELRALSELTGDVDVVFAPAALAEQVRATAPSARIVPLAVLVHDPAFDKFIRQLEEATVIRAERTTDEPKTGDGRIILRYRGNQRVPP